LEGYPKQLILKDGTEVSIRPMTKEDGKKLLDFFIRLPKEDRQFLKEDVSRKEVVQRFVDKLDYDKILPVLAFYDNEIVGDATLHRSDHGWSKHVGEIRVVVSRQFQKKGLGLALARHLTEKAVDAGLDKMVAEVMDNQIGGRKAFESLGFEEEARLKGHVRDIFGHKRDLIIMANDISHLWEAMEHMIKDYMPSLDGIHP